MHVAIKELQSIEKEVFNRYFSNPNDDQYALDCAKEFTSAYDTIVKSVVSETTDNLNGVAIYAFGSPARYEMLGQSDLDCMIIRKDDIDVKDFRRDLLANLRRFNFSKLDVPVWGTLSDCKSYISTAITEGNQVVEARFLMGDQSVANNIEKLREEHCTPDRFRATFCFQYLYFEQYYRQRIRPNQINLKYGHGGTRDFLFPVWLANLREGYKYVQNGNPSILRGIDSLIERRDITLEDANNFILAANIIALMRNELLRISRGTSDSGLTYLSQDTARQLCESAETPYNNPNLVLQRGHWAATKIKELKELCYKVFLKEEGVREQIGNNAIPNANSELGSIVLSWQLDLSQGDKNIVQRLASMSSWSVLTSLACNTTCPTGILDELANSGMQKGYEYILKVVGRNQNTSKKTLEKIANCGTEARFKEPAITRLEKGWKKANESQ